ncbi:MAG TPA: gamma-aminobutyrate permease, partial [Lactobacillus sp.]|nr:gamma-aminobutyrate permease [Lactobacillus sp.]
FGPLLALVLCVLVIVGQNTSAFAHFDWEQIAVTYLSVPLFFILFFYYKIRHHTHLIPLDEVDVAPHKRQEVED